MAVKYNAEPLFDQVLIRPSDPETKTASGIIIPDNVQEKPKKGRIIALGTGLAGKTFTVAVGDLVMYSKYAGTELEVNGENLLMMKESDLKARLHEIAEPNEE